MTSKKSLPEPIRNFLEYSKRIDYKTESTLECYRIDLLQYAKYLQIYEKGKDLLDATDADIEKFVRWLGSEGRSPRTIYRKFSTLKTFYTWVRENIDKSIKVSEDLEPPSIVETLPEILTIDQVKAMVKVTASERDKALVMFMYDTAVRVGEVPMITTYMIDWKSNVVKFSRILFFSENTKNALLDYTNKKTPGDHLFLSQRQTALSERRIQTILQEIAQKAGIENYKNLSANVLRHSRAVHLLDGGMKPKALARFLGVDIKQVSVYKELAYRSLMKELRKFDINLE